MINISLRKFLVLLSVLVLLSCKKFLDKVPDDRVIPTLTKDYDLLLNSQNLSVSGSSLMDLMTDNVDLSDAKPTAVSSASLAYFWADQLNVDVNETTAIWAKHYSNIYVYNLVINNVENSLGGADGLKKTLKAEALLGRAFEFLYLLNLYGKPYDKNTAKTDLAVPFITANDISQRTPERATVQFIYDQIISDVKSAIDPLPVVNALNKFRGSKIAAYSVLARIYLLKGDYAEAQKYALLVLNSGHYQLYDLNKDPLPFATRNEQEIYLRVVSNNENNYVDLAFLHLFPEGDLRLFYFYTNPGLFLRGFSTFYLYPQANNYGTSVAEMKLIVAEAAARTNQLPLALQQLNELRAYRTRQDAFLPVFPGGQQEVLERVLLERRFELAFKGFRWIDMRRLDAEGKMPPISRFDAQYNMMRVLEPHSSSYTLKIPASVLRFNPGMPQN